MKKKRQKKLAIIQSNVYTQNTQSYGIWNNEAENSKYTNIQYVLKEGANYHE